MGSMGERGGEWRWGKGIQPYIALLALDIETTPRVHGYICEDRVEIVVRGPEPVVLRVEAFFGRSNVHGHEGGDAGFVDV